MSLGKSLWRQCHSQDSDDKWICESFCAEHRSMLGEPRENLLNFGVSLEAIAICQEHYSTDLQ